MSARNILIVMADQLTPFMVGCYGNGAGEDPAYGPAGVGRRAL